MSARQRARIANQNLIELPGGGNDDSSDSSEDETFKAVATTKTFQFDSSSESSENESDTNADSGHDDFSKIEEIPTADFVEKPIRQSKPPMEVKKEQSYDELEYLESVIEANIASEKERDTSMERLLFTIDDVKQLDVTAVLRRRQGQQAMVFEGGAEQGARRGGIHGPNRNRGLGRTPIAAFGVKKVIFGAPSEDWPRPPAFVAGGLGMSRVKADSSEDTTTLSTSTFTFEWSPEFRFLQSQYQFIIGSGDANMLVMFLAHFPHHPQGLLELSRVYAGLGQPDKSAELVRRALYVLECASLEAFKPTGASSRTFASRLDPGKQENAVYFEVLRRHLQLCSTQGCHGVAMEVCRYLICLWPADTSHMLLLVLDHYLLTAQRHDFMLAYCGVSANSTALSALASSSSTPLPPNLAQALSFTFSSPYRFYPPQSSTSSGGGTETKEAKEASLQDMPNWWFSLAMSAFGAERRHTTLPSASLSPTSPSRTTLHASSTPNTTNNANSANNVHSIDLPSASIVLKSALLRWPCMLRPLLIKIGVDVGPPGVVTLITGTSPAAQWRKILAHCVFAEAVDRIPIELRAYLEKVSEVYALRNAALWGREDEVRWLLQCCTELTTEIGVASADNSVYQAYLEAQRAHFAHLLTVDAHGVLSKYAHARLTDYSDTVPRLPDDLNPLDPSLDDIQYVLSGAVKFRDFMDSEGRFLFPVPEPYMSTVKSTGLSGARRTAAQGRNQIGMAGVAGGVLGYLAGRVVRGLYGPDGGELHPGRANIDLNLPLMQLFLATIFPWIFVPPVARRNLRE